MPESVVIRSLTVSMDMITLPLEDIEMVYFELSLTFTPLNCHMMVGVGSPLTLHEKEADWPIGTPMLRGPPTIIAPATERERERELLQVKMSLFFLLHVLAQI